jgi:hypothetical protein
LQALFKQGHLSAATMAQLTAAPSEGSAGSTPAAWRSLRELYRSGESVIQLQQEAFAGVRQELANNAAFINRLGFDCKGSFGARVFRGEFKILQQAVATMAPAPAGAALKAAVDAVSRQIGICDALLGTLAAQAERAIPALSAVDQMARPDLENIVNAVRGKTDPLVLSIAAERRISHALRAVTGQCLDPWSGRNAPYNLAWMDGFSELLVAREPDGTMRANALLYGARLEREEDKPQAVLVLDVPYTSDGSVLTTDKRKGFINAALRRAEMLGIPCVLSKATLQDQVDAPQAALNEFGLKGTLTAQQALKIVVAPGASGSLYLELNGFDCIHSTQEYVVQAMLYLPATGRAQY